MAVVYANAYFVPVHIVDKGCTMHMEPIYWNIHFSLFLEGEFSSPQLSREAKYFLNKEPFA